MIIIIFAIIIVGIVSGFCLAALLHCNSRKEGTHGVYDENEPI